MKLMPKTLVVTAAVLAVSVTVIAALLTFVVSGGFSRLETAYARRNVDRVRMALSDRQESLTTTVGDWTTWDAMYRFAADRDRVFVDENLSADAMATLKVDLLLVVDAAHEIVWSGLLTADGASRAELPAELRALAAPTSPMTALDAGTRMRAGVVMTAGKPMIVSARPILTSKSEGPAHGVVLMGRYLDARSVAAISSSLCLDVSLHAPETKDGLLSRTSSTLVMTGTVDDVYGRPAFSFRVAMPRDIYAQGAATIRLVVVVSAVAGVAVILAVMVLLRAVVLMPVLRLSGAIDEITVSKDFSRRVAVRGRDELAGLARDMNELLESVVVSRRELAEAHQEMEDLSQSLRRLEREQFQAILDEMGDAAVVCDGEWSIREMNDAAAEALQLQKGARFDLLKHLYAQFELSVPQDALTASRGESIRFEVVRRQTAQTKAAYFEAVLDAIDGPSGAVMRRVLVLRDVSEKRRNEIMKHDFVGLVAHRLCSPVAALAENADRLRGLKEGAVVAAGDHARFAAVFGQVDALKSLNEKLLAFADASGAHQSMLADTISLQTYLIGRAQKMYDVGRVVDIRVDCPDRTLTLTTSKMSLDLIMDNLIENAVKFGDKDPTQIVLFAVRTQRGIEISVTDNGPGLPQSAAGSAPSRSQGIGLALVKRLVEACAGTVEVRSVEGQSTRFTMVFPGA